MSTQYRCGTEGRRQAMLRQDAAASPINGIDYLVVVEGEQRVLRVRFFFPLPAGALSEENVRIRGGVRVRDPAVTGVVRLADLGDLPEWAADLTDRENWLIVTVAVAGDYSPYRLSLHASSEVDAPPPGFDLRLSEVEFSFKVDCESPFDCRVEERCQPEVGPAADIDYLARDFASFRRLMFDRLAFTQPDEPSRDPATLRAAIVELLAHEADLAAYFQDGVATEAYLGTARRRPSVRRHARLLEYHMHEGCNARTFVHLALRPELALGAPFELPVGARFLTRLPEVPAMVPADELPEVTGTAFEVFEALHRVGLNDAHNEIALHTWGDGDCCLPRGATSAALVRPATELFLHPGDFLVLEEVAGRETKLAADADPARRHVVRLSRVNRVEDQLLDVEVLEVEWSAEDALPFPLFVSAEGTPLAVARGNLVLVDHGHTVEEPLALRPFGNQGRRRARLGRAGVTFSDQSRWFARRADTPASPLRSAAASMVQDPRQAGPELVVLGEGDEWRPQRDLLGSGAGSAELVVETETDGRAWLRFGDGTFGRSPAVDDRGIAVDGRPFRARYRVGNGASGNVGAEAIAHLVTDVETTALVPLVVHVRNPIAARGGAPPETIDEVQLYAPQAFREQQRAVTEADWVVAAQRHPGVQRAAATIRWTGSWFTVFIAIDRLGGAEVTPAFEAELLEFLDRFRLAGYDLELGRPRYVPLDIALTICVAEGHLRDRVERDLRDELGSGHLAGGRLAFFHPDNFTFAQPVYLSRLIARASAVPGVAWVDVTPGTHDNRFRRRGRPAGDEIDEGRIPIRSLEIARCDSDPNAPENGQIQFFMEGGA